MGHGYVVRARVQSEGRGRGTHPWFSPPGGLYLSVILPPIDEADPLVSISLGAALVRLFRSAYGVPVWLMWPNDIVLGGNGGGMRKLAGLLVDRVAGPGGTFPTVVGVGVNVSTPREDFPPSLRDQVATLREFCPSVPSLPELEESVVAAILETAERFRSAPERRALLDQAREALYGAGRFGSVEGRRLGRIRGLADDGSLLLEDSEGKTVAIQNGPIAIEGS
jgi:BirA family biotin operon repressor/biotin-[acetyl-CoA-carboxylase] ligase